MYIYQSTRQKDSTIIFTVMCAIIFSIFSFFWLYWFQSDLLYITQHILSEKKTHYNDFVGAILITGVLQGLQYFVNNLLRLGHHSHALSYVPSFLILAIVSDIYPEQQQFFNHHHWLIILPIALLLWGGLVWTIKQLSLFDGRRDNNHWVPRQLWINLLELNLMMFFVAMMGNTEVLAHYNAHMEKFLLRGNVDEALRTGSRSQQTDQRLTMLRSYALTQKGMLATNIFDFPIVGTGEDLLPLNNSSVAPLLLPYRNFYKPLGAQPIAFSSTYRYLDVLEGDSLATPAAKDYYLIGLLIDRKLDYFISHLQRYREITDELPKCYREALILYTHLRSNPSIVYHHPVLDEDWSNFNRMKEAPLSYHAQKRLIQEHYRSSYWYYYFFEK